MVSLASPTADYGVGRCSLEGSRGLSRRQFPRWITLGFVSAATDGSPSEKSAPSLSSGQAVC